MKKIILTLAAAVLSGFALSAQNDDIKCGPWVTDVSDTALTVLWTTQHPGMGWVETKDSCRRYDCFAGRRTFGSFHSVRLKKLNEAWTGGHFHITVSDPEGNILHSLEF